jgi:DNA-binding GntR family transcriptional regulator
MEPGMATTRPLAPGTPRSGVEPAYARLVRVISEEIAAGAHRPGAQLPSEAQLRARFKVSGMTVRRAVNILVDRGLVTASQGKGTFVRGLDMSEALFSLTERAVLADPLDRTVHLLGAVILPASAAVAMQLKLERGASVVYLQRLVLQAKQPIMCNREYLHYDPRKPIVEAELQITSLEGLFRGQVGQGLRRGDLTMEAVAVDHEEAELLRLSVGDPGLRLEHTLFDFENHPVAWGWFTCRADKYHLTSHIGPDSTPDKGGPQ